VEGQNYRESEILAAHSAKPSRKILGTENQHGSEVWRALRDNPPYAGQFLWAGIDYLGESRRWPTVSSASGLLDRTGAVKPQGYQRQSWWSEKPMVRMVRRVTAEVAGPVDPGYEAAERRRLRTLYEDWTPASTAAHEENVEVYSNCQEVELYLNGKSLGSKSLPADASPRSWRVPYEPGTIRAVGRNGGREAAAHELRTAGPAAAIVLSSDRGTLSTAWDDVAYVTATVVDGKGVMVPNAETKIAFEATGPGILVAVDNADASSLEPFQAAQRTVFDGQCIAILRASAPGGQIALKAAAAGLVGGSIRIATAGVK
jgi:beta-galactosidase